MDLDFGVLGVVALFLPLLAYICGVGYAAFFYF